MPKTDPKPLALHIDVKEKKRPRFHLTVDQATVDLIRQRSALGIVTACLHAEGGVSASAAFWLAHRRITRKLCDHLGVTSLDDLDPAVLAMLYVASDIETRPLDSATDDDLIASADAIDPGYLTKAERASLDALRAVLRGQ